jgi:pyruvate dehydrogenase E1 component alpha subunit
MGHFEGDPDRYRDDDEREQTRGRDAIAALRGRLLADGLANEAELEQVHAELEAAVSAAVEFAQASPVPDPAEVERYVYPEPLAAVEAGR